MKTVETLQDLVEALPAREDTEILAALGSDDVDRWTGQRLLNASRAIAKRFSADGAKRNGRVAIIGENEPAWIAACLGVIHAGLVVIPIDAQFNDDSLRTTLDDCRPDWLVAPEWTLKRIDKLDTDANPQTLSFERIAREEPRSAESEADAFEAKSVAPEDIAAIFYTSGTTGPPKGVPLSHGNLTHQLKVVPPMNLLQPSERMLVPLPFHHVYAFSIGLMLPLLLGSVLVLPAALTGPQLRRAMREESVSVILGVPRLYRALRDGIEGRISGSSLPLRWLLQGALGMALCLRRRFGIRRVGWLTRPMSRRLGPSLRVVASGGSSLEFDLACFLEAMGWELATGYGLTETSPLLTLDPPGNARIRSVGKPIDGIELRIAKSEDAPSSDSETGEVQARGPSVFRGYLGREEETERAFTGDDWFKTGDLGWFDDDGYLYLSGRASTLIITEAGENLQPDQIEEAYEAHSHIEEAGVFQKENRLVALLVPDAENLSEEDRKDPSEAIRQAVEEVGSSLPSYQRIGEHAVSRRKLPRTRLGKLKRKALEEAYDSLRREEKGDSNGPEKRLADEELSAEDKALLEDPGASAAWETLKRKFPDRRITADTNFQIDLGIDSMEWLNLSLEIQESADVELGEETIAEIETVRDLLRIVSEGAESKEEAEDPFREPEKSLDSRRARWLAPQKWWIRSVSNIGYKLNRWAIRACFGLEIDGLENLPERGPVLIAPNHRSYLDGPALAAGLEPRRRDDLYWSGVSKIVLANPIMRAITRVARIVPVEPGKSAISNLLIGAAVLRKERYLVWFPEGRVSPDGELQELQSGIGLLADRCDAPILPVWIDGSRAALPPGGKWPRPRRRLRIRFGELIEPERFRKAGDEEATRDRIVEALREALIRLRENGA